MFIRSRIRSLASGRFLAAACTAGALATPAPAVAADAYPVKPVKVIVNSAPGGLTDIIGRLVAAKMGQSMGQQWVVENKGGAAVIGADALAKSAPDGYTVGVLGSSLSALPALIPKMPFNPETDLVPVSLLVTSTLVLITGANSPYRTVADYIAEAKKKPSQLTYASGGTGTMTHLLAEQLQISAGVSLIQIPYKGGAPALSDLMAGHVAIYFDQIGTTVPLARDGKVRPLAIIANTRWPAFPDVPTMAEAGYPNVQGTSWYGLFAPAGTPADIVAKLNAEANKALQSPEVKERLLALGTTPKVGSPQVLADLLKGEIPRLTRLIRERNIKTD